MGSRRSCQAVALLIVWWTGACVSWHPVTVSPGEDDLPTRLRIQSVEGERFVLHDPRWLGDSSIEGTRRVRSVMVSTAVPVDGIEVLEAPVTNVAKSVLLGTGLAALGLMIVMAIAWSDFDHLGSGSGSIF